MPTLYSLTLCLLFITIRISVMPAPQHCSAPELHSIQSTCVRFRTEFITPA